jgi:hypothetical protein
MTQRGRVYPGSRDGHEGDKRDRRGDQARPKADFFKLGVDRRAEARRWGAHSLVSAGIHSMGRYR